MTKPYNRVHTHVLRTIYTGGNMNTHMKKFFVVVGATIALAGCSLTQPLSTKQTSPVKEDAGAVTVPIQTTASPTSEMGSPSYKVESTTPATTPAPTTTTSAVTKAKSDDPADLQKDLDSVSIESDFGSLVK